MKIGKKTILVGGISAGLLLLAAVWVGTACYNYAVREAVQQEGFLYIPTDGTYAGLLDSLAAHDFLKNTNAFDRMARQKGLPDGLLAGRYEIKKGMTLRSLLGMLKGGLQKPLNVTFNTIRTMDRLAGVVARYLEPDTLALLAVLTDDAVAARYGFKPETFIGMFIPNTYQFFWNTSPTGFLDRMRKEYDAFWTDERQARCDALNLSREEVTTLASIVAEETRMSDEMPRVAGVYLNRLRIGMLLQADPTVKYATGDFTLRRILFRHLEIDSPYNTYKNKGLPPGPICMPSIRAVDAVLNAEKHDYIFFCAKEDFSGYHNFAATLAQHNANALRWSQALNRRGIK
ncbi:MAG: endolytic transglycosylase MltG [Rikenellaceae bacterium]|nr:endolytic transglycosylase MltG [Rikenellaceae bacterium]